LHQVIPYTLHLLRDEAVGKEENHRPGSTCTGTVHIVSLFVPVYNNQNSTTEY